MYITYQSVLVCARKCNFLLPRVIPSIESGLEGSVGCITFVQAHCPMGRLCSCAGKVKFNGCQWSEGSRKFAIMADWKHRPILPLPIFRPALTHNTILSSCPGGKGLAATRVLAFFLTRLRPLSASCTAWQQRAYLRSLATPALVLELTRLARNRRSKHIPSTKARMKLSVEVLIAAFCRIGRRTTTKTDISLVQGPPYYYHLLF